MTDTERNIIALIEEKIRGCDNAAKARPDKAGMHDNTKRVLSALIGDIEQGLHGDEGWQRWTRPGIPCHPDAIIEIRTLDGSTDKGKACNFTWSTQCGWATIVEWREISPQT